VGGGPSADFNHALKIARDMVWCYGMGKSGLIGDFRSYMHSDFKSGMLSDKVKETLEDDVQDILQTCLKEVRELLMKHKDLMECFAEELLKKGELEYDEIQAIFDKFGLQPMSGRPRLTI
jgi:ATP-dependent Zn protease